MEEPDRMVLACPYGRVYRRLVASTPLRCRLGYHVWVQEHPPDERLQGPDHKVCGRCGKRRNANFGAVPPGIFG